MPRAIAPDVTSTTDAPPACNVAAWSTTSETTSRRTSPYSSATMLEPSVMTYRPVITRRRSPGGMGSIPPTLRAAGVELEQRAGDLDVVARREAGALEGADHAQRTQSLLDVPAAARSG